MLWSVRVAEILFSFEATLGLFILRQTAFMNVNAMAGRVFLRPLAIRAKKKSHSQGLLI